MPPRESRHRGRPGLTPRMRLALAAFVEALFAREDGPPPADRVAWCVEETHDFFAHAGGRARLLFRVCLLAVSIFAPLSIRRLPPFRRLDHASRVHALERFERTVIGLALLGVKAMVCIVWYEHPDSIREIEANDRCLLPLAPPDTRGEAAE